MITATMGFRTHFRPLTCASAPSPSYPARLVPHPPDLTRWVRREGGFVHKDLTIAEGESFGLGLVASEEISKGSELISLPSHLPLRFRSLDPSDGADASDSALVHLSRRVPGLCYLAFILLGF